jgi:hypothetical protein
MSPNASRASDTYGLLEMKRFVFFLVRLSSSSTSQFENCLTGIPSSVGLACSTASCQLKNQVARSPITETASLCARCGKMYLGTQPPRAIARLMASCVTHYGEPRAEPRPVAPYSVLFLSQPPSHPIVTHPHTSGRPDGVRSSATRQSINIGPHSVFLQSTCLILAPRICASALD